MKASEIDSAINPIRENQDDEVAGYCDARRPRLTLRHLHRLRLINDLKKQEAAQERRFVRRMYGGTFEDSDEKAKDSRKPPNLVKPPKPLKPLEPTSRYLDKHKPT